MAASSCIFVNSVMELRLHRGIDILDIVILFDSLDEFLDISLILAFKLLELHIRESGELCRNQLITVVLNVFLD